MIFSPIVSKILRRRQPDVRAFHVAPKSWVIDPAEELPSLPAIFSPDDLERVTGYASHSFREQEEARLAAGTVHRGATTASELRDVVLCGGNLYAGRFKHTMRDARKLLSRITAELPDAGIPSSSWLGGLYFGHWLGEDTPMKMMARDMGRPTELAFPQTPHQLAYNALFGITPDLLPDDALVRKAVLVESDLFSRFRGAGWRRMTDRINARYSTATHIGCMLLRGSSGSKRILVNEQEIAQRLRSLGFKTVDPSTSTLEEILAATSGARMIVGVEGSQLAHGFHCLGAGGAMVVLQPPDRFGCIDKSRCDIKDVRYAFLVGRQEPLGFRIETDPLLKLIDRVAAELRPVSNEAL